MDVRLLSATHKNLAELVALGRFREDLYYRINVIELRVPALRERREDIPELAEHILTRLARRMRHRRRRRCRREALAAARRVSVPGQRARTGEHPRARADAVRATA